MTHPTRRFRAGVAIALFVGLSAPAVALDAPQVVKARAGQTVLNDARLGDLNAVAGSVYVSIKPAEALELLNDYRHYAAFYPGIDRSEILSRQGGETVVAMDGDEGEVVTKRRKVGGDKIEIELVKARDFKDLNARWEVEAEGEGTMVTYTLGVATKMPWPGFIVAGKLRDKMTAIMGNTRKYLDSKGKWSQK